MTLPCPTRHQLWMKIWRSYETLFLSAVRSPKHSFSPTHPPTHPGLSFLFYKNNFFNSLLLIIYLAIRSCIFHCSWVIVLFSPCFYGNCFWKNFSFLSSTIVSLFSATCSILVFCMALHFIFNYLKPTSNFHNPVLTLFLLSSCPFPLICIFRKMWAVQPVIYCSYETDTRPVLSFVL